MHPLVAASLNNLAVMLQELGDYDGAEPLRAKRWRCAANCSGAEHPDVAASLANLASVLQDKARVRGSRATLPAGAGVACASCSAKTT